MGFSYSVDEQNESYAFNNLVHAAERWLMVYSLEKTFRNRDDVKGATDQAKIAANKSTTNAKTLSKTKIDVTRETEATKRLLLP